MKFSVLIYITIFICNVSYANSRCIGFYSGNKQSEINEKVLAQVSVVQKNIEIPFGYTSGVQFKTKHLTDLPKGTRKIKVELDKIDQSLFALTDEFGAEFGRLEVQNQKGETLGVVLFTTGNEHFIGSETFAEAFHRVLAQAWSTGEFFDIKKLVWTHTHPRVIGGYTGLFSDGDLMGFNGLKAHLEALGLYGSSLEASIVYPGFIYGKDKKTVVIPPENSVKNNDYLSQSVEDLSKIDVRRNLFVKIASLGDLITHNEIDLKDFIFFLPENVKVRLKSLLDSN